MAALKVGVRVVYTPGHSLGSICLLLASEVTGGDAAIFTGDHMVPGMGWNVVIQLVLVVISWDFMVISWDFMEV